MRAWPIIYTLAVGIVLGCSEQKAPSKSAPQAKQAETPTVLTEAQKQEIPSLFTKTGEDYTYNPVGKRDPFRAYAGELVQEVSAIATSPLERFELDQLKLTGIVWGIASPRALIQAPDGQSYIVRKDMRIGTHRGRVSRITRRELFIEEEYRDPTGKLVVRESMLEIRPPEQEKEKDKMQIRFQDE